MNLTLTPPNNYHTSAVLAGPNPIQPSLNSDEILRGQKAVDIKHNGSTYKLQATRLGKLILTK